MTDRVAVFHEGRVSAVLDTRRTSQEEIMQYASGQGTAPRPPAFDRPRDVHATDRQKTCSRSSRRSAACSRWRSCSPSPAAPSSRSATRMTVALQVTSIAYLGIGATCVIITGGIDLCVGAMLALAGVVAALAVKAGAAGAGRGCAGCCVGALCRAVQRPVRHAAQAAAVHRDAGHDAGGARRRRCRSPTAGPSRACGDDFAELGNGSLLRVLQNRRGRLSRTSSSSASRTRCC